MYGVIRNRNVSFVGALSYLMAPIYHSGVVFIFSLPINSFCNSGLVRFYKILPESLV